MAQPNAVFSRRTSLWPYVLIPVVATLALTAVAFALAWQGSRGAAWALASKAVWTLFATGLTLWSFLPQG